MTRKRICWLLVNFSIGLACWLVLGALIREYPAMIGRSVLAGGVDIDKDVNLDVAQPNLEPDDVVRMQVNSIRDAVHDIVKLKVCYSLASPSNRKFTGPFPRFAELVMLPPYDSLATSLEWQMGSAFVDKNVAAVLVSTISKKGEVLGFRFVLRRQNFPRPDCWLTEAVEFLAEEAVGLTGAPENEVERRIE